MRPPWLRGVVLALVLAGCRQSAPVPVTSEPVPGASTPTTEASTALHNLESALRAREREIELDASALARVGPELIEALLMRGQYLARVSDTERALVLADRMLASQARRGETYVLRARARSALHRWEDARLDLRAAERSGADATAVAAAGASIDQARGGYEEALAVRRWLARERPGVYSIGAEAAVLAEMDRPSEAAARFQAARESYRDVSPFPLAWLDFQEGRMWMRAGRLQAARSRLLAAHQRLPQYVAAACHLGEVEAALGDTDRAIALLHAAASVSEDPDPMGQLARVLAAVGRPGAAFWRDRAAQRYDELMQRHPAAFADHGAEFWLGPGGDPKKALGLARANFRLRPTPVSRELKDRAEAAAS